MRNETEDDSCDDGDATTLCSKLQSSDINGNNSTSENLMPEFKRNVQPQITQVMKSVQSFRDGTGKSEQITNAIVFMIVKDNLPFRTVEKNGFTSLLKLICPLYHPPSRDKVTELIDLKYDELSLHLKNKFSNLNCVSLTCDVWTDTTNTQSFLGVSAHYLYKGNLESSVIGVTDLHESHTGVYLSSILEKTCTQWNIEPSKIAAVVSDNAANIINAIERLFDNKYNIKNLPCLAHTLNLCVTESIDKTKDLKALLEGVKDIVTYFKRCVNAADGLKKITGDDFDKPTRLIQSVVTRWNSTFYMVQRFLLLKTDVATVLLTSSKAPKMMSGMEIEILEQVSILLKPFECIVREICSEKQVTCGKIIPTIYNLLDDLNSVVTHSNIAIELKNNLVKSLETRFNKVEFNLIPAVSMFMDPRFKRIYFKSPTADSKLIQYVDQKLKEQNTSNQFEELNNNGTNSLQGIWKHHQKRSINSQRTSDQNDIGFHFELKQYLQEQVISINQDPIDYWNNRKKLFPLLYNIAEKFLSIPATSVPSERMFSMAGNIMTKPRNRILPERLQKLLFLQCLKIEEWSKTTE